jgi:SAM-dependent methyltransferase
MGDTTQAFGPLADNYHRFRPDYPAEALAAVRSYLARGRDPGWPDRWLLLDVGSGTGISTRALHGALGPSHDLVGVEPGQAMLEQAGATGNGQQGIRYLQGRAEAIPFGDSVAMMVLAAQAVQWFDRPAFYREAVRVLRPGGTLALIQNDRDWRASPVLEDYELLMERHGDGYSRFYRSFPVAAELDALDGVGEPRDLEVPWVRELDRESFVGFAFSSTKMHAVARRLGTDRARAEIEAILDRHGVGGSVEIPYLTRLFLRRRAA